MSAMLRLFPVCGVVVFLGVGIAWRSWLQWRRYGASGIILFRTGDWWHHLRDAAFVALLTLMAGQAAAFACFPDEVSRLFLVSLASNAANLLAGRMLVLLGTVVVVTAQLQMGASWRIGIDSGAKPGLVVGGLYGVCRNPIYLGIFLILAGLTLLLPTWISLAMLLGTIAGVRAQVLREETYLTATYGDGFRQYSKRVGRFVPGIGRLA